MKEGTDKVDFHLLFGSNQIHLSLQKYVSNQKTALHFRCESWREWLQVDFSVSHKLLQPTEMQLITNKQDLSCLQSWDAFWTRWRHTRQLCHSHHFQSKSMQPRIKGCFNGLACSLCLFYLLFFNLFWKPAATSKSCPLFVKIHYYFIISLFCH